MTPPTRPSRPSPTEPEPEPSGISEVEFEQQMEEVERSLVALKERYAQIQQDRQRQAELQQDLKQVKQEWQRTHLPTLKVELRRLKQQLETIELNLESQLFSWRSLREPFWQAVRLAGLGIVIGWILKYCAG